VVDFLDQMKVDHGGHMDSGALVIGGATWVMTANQDGTWSINPPWIETPAQAEMYLKNLELAAAIIIGSIVVIIAFVAGYNSADGRPAKVVVDDEAIREARKELRTQKRDLDLREKEMALALEQNNKEAERLRKLEEELGRQYQNAMVGVQNAQAMLTATPKEIGPGAIGKYLRDRHVKGAAFGELITATFLADRTGFLRLGWTVQSDRPMPPTVHISRDQKLVRTDCSFAGEHGDHILPGRRYVYEFSLRDDRDKPLGKPLTLEVKLPIRKTWDTEQDTGDDERQKKIRDKFNSKFNGLKAVEELRQKFQAEVKIQKHPQDVEEWLLSQIDALASDLRGGG
jgi:hypothetical protein